VTGDIAGSDFINPAEVAAKVSDAITAVLETFAKQHGLVVTPWYHDLPVWLAGPIQVSLVRSRGNTRVEVHNGELGQQSFNLAPGTIKADLNRVLGDLAILGLEKG
jgi:hypothetical protein